MSIIGIIIMGIEFPAFESLGNKYIWSNVSTNFNDNSVIVLDITEKYSKWHNGIALIYIWIEQWFGNCQESLEVT